MKVWVYFARPKHWNPISGAIQKSEGMDSSHVLLSYQSMDFNEKMIIHSKLFNTHSMTFKNFLKDSEIVKGFEFELTPEQFRSGMAALAPEMGSIYAYLQLFLMLFKRLFKIVFTFEAIGNMCSEVVAKFLWASGAVPSDGSDSCDAGLIETFEMCAKHGRLM